MSKLKAWRLSRKPKMTQTDLAERLGCTTPTVCKIEAGEQVPKIPLLLKIEKATRGAVSVVDILNDAYSVGN
jgi:DNA-binding XRE family transcriptional regulator